MTWNHAHRVPGQPSLPHLGDELTGSDVVGKPNRAIRVSRVAGGHTPVVEQVGITLFREGWSSAKILPERLERPGVVVTQCANGAAKIGKVADLKQGISRVCRQPSPQIRAQHG